MSWHDLAFLHWPLPLAQLAPLVPPGLSLDTFDGHAWLGVVPFRMEGVRPRLLPAVPGLSAFPEINLRTYVTAGGKPGVWFFSLDVPSRLAVRVARATFHLPYFHASMRCEAHGEGVHYLHRRTHRGAPAADFEARYAPTGPARPAAPGSLEAFLVERYCLYSADRRGQVFRGDIEHDPWPLQPGEVELIGGDLCAQIGVRPEGPPLVHFARRLDVHAWSLDSV